MLPPVYEPPELSLNLLFWTWLSKTCLVMLRAPKIKAGIPPMILGPLLTVLRFPSRVPCSRFFSAEDKAQMEEHLFQGTKGLVLSPAPAELGTGLLSRAGWTAWGWLDPLNPRSAPVTHTSHSRLRISLPAPHSGLFRAANLKTNTCFLEQTGAGQFSPTESNSYRASSGLRTHFGSLVLSHNSHSFRELLWADAGVGVTRKG